MLRSVHFLLLIFQSKTNNELIKHSSESKGMIQFLSGDPKSILQTLPSQNVIDGKLDFTVYINFILCLVLFW